MEIMRSMKAHFTRKEIMQLSGVSSMKLFFLEKHGFIKPEKRGNRKPQQSFYTWDDLLELKLISKLRQDASLQQLRIAKDYLIKIGESNKLSDEVVIAANNKIYLIKNIPSEIGKLVIQLSGTNKGQVIIDAILKISDLVDELWDAAEKENIIDFAARAKQKRSRERKVA